MAGADDIDHGEHVGVSGRGPSHAPVPDIRILLFEQAREPHLLVGGRSRKTYLQEPGKQCVQFARAAPASPAQPAWIQGGRFACRAAARFDGYAPTLSTSSFLVSAIAFAGLSPLGHVFVQFMMVWQR